MDNTRNFTWVDDRVLDLCPLFDLENPRQYKIISMFCKSCAVVTIVASAIVFFASAVITGKIPSPYILSFIVSILSLLTYIRIFCDVKYLQVIERLHAKTDCIQYSLFGCQREVFIEIWGYAQQSKNLAGMSENELIRKLNIPNPTQHLVLLKSIANSIFHFAFLIMIINALFITFSTPEKEIVLLFGLASVGVAGWILLNQAAAETMRKKTGWNGNIRLLKKRSLQSARHEWAEINKLLVGDNNE